MVWNPPSSWQSGSFNHPALGSHNHAAYGSPNHAAYGSPNHAAYGSPNHAAYGSPNHAAYGSPNHAAYGSPNHAAMPALGQTGAGMPSGAGFLGGYGPVARSDYATPASLGPLPWTLDFSPGNGWQGFPTQLRLNPADFTPPLEWKTSDWDPGLRFWTLPFDPQLTEWLQDLDLAAPAVMAAREFAAQHKRWDTANANNSLYADFVSQPFMDWKSPDKSKAWSFINRELTELEDMMVDDRFRYMQEAAVQSSSIGTYFVHLLGIDSGSKPWTMELMNCATAIANMVKMHYKAHFRRVRPSTLCPALTPPWGPPQHPAFPSGHSMVAHLTALFLLSIPALAERFGVFNAELEKDEKNLGDKPSLAALEDPKTYGTDQRSLLLWLAWRVAKNRERLGVHYPSDSAASRYLAAHVWHLCLEEADDSKAILCPTLKQVLQKAIAEWPAAQKRPDQPAAPKRPLSREVPNA